MWEWGAAGSLPRNKTSTSCMKARLGSSAIRSESVEIKVGVTLSPLPPFCTLNYDQVKLLDIINAIENGCAKH